jgi:hypothetical protein
MDSVTHRMQELLGEALFLRLCQQFPNARIPGRRYLMLSKREKFWELCASTCRSTSEIARELKISRQTVYRWERQQIDRRRHATVSGISPSRSARR